MATDIIAQDMAAQALAARPRVPVALGIYGQSNERGAVDSVADGAAFPQAFASLRNPGGPRVPIGYSGSNLGGWWSKVYDDLWDWGYDLQIVNGAVGSLSFMRDAAGMMENRGSGSSYYAKRVNGGYPDRGHYGSMISPQASRVFQATAAKSKFAFLDGPLTPAQSEITTTGTGNAAAANAITGSIAGSVLTVTAAAGTIAIGQDVASTAGVPFATIASLGTGTGGTGTYNLDSSPTGYGTAQALAIQPGFRNKNVGDIVTDGSVTWTCISTTPTSWGGVTGVSAGGTVFTEAQKGIGFDPLATMARLHEEMGRIRGVTRKIIYIANGQADLGFSTGNYSSALQSIAGFFLARGYEVMIGYTCYSAASGNIAQHDALSAGVTAAIAALKAGSYAARVYAGANLYAAMGTSGPMAAGGAFFRQDGVNLNLHLNGAGAVGPDIGGVSCAGRYVSDSVKAVLPRVWR